MGKAGWVDGKDQSVGGYGWVGGYMSGWMDAAVGRSVGGWAGG